MDDGLAITKYTLRSYSSQTWGVRCLLKLCNSLRKHDEVPKRRALFGIIQKTEKSKIEVILYFTKSFRVMWIYQTCRFMESVKRSQSFHSDPKNTKTYKQYKCKFSNPPPPKKNPCAAVLWWKETDQIFRGKFYYCVT